jgi:uncharacterized membrane protein YidH (DUF202 family)
MTGSPLTAVGRWRARWLSLKEPASTPAAAVGDNRLVLAYDAATNALKSQDGTFGNIRTRASTVLATAALLTSFAAGLGLINTDRAKGAVLPVPAAWLLLALLLLVGGLVLFVQWPVRVWRYGPSAGVILERRDRGDSEDSIREFVTKKMIDGIGANRAVLTRRQNALRASVFLLLVEVVVLVCALTLFG